jgi:acyl CoA:acetate/3-ketoacid CoA transferase
MTVSKVISAQEAVRLVRSGSTLAVGGAGGVQEPDLLIEQLVARYRKEGAPAAITEFHPIRCGEVEGRGTSLFAEKGMVRRMIGGSFWPVGVPPLIQRIHDNDMEAYNLPIGVMYAMLEATAAGRPGVVTRVGLDTCMDPRNGGGALNASSTERLSELVTLGGETFLFYRSLPVDVAFIRATTADTAGNLSLEGEPADCGSLVLAQAARASGGKVIAQVKRIVPKGSLDPRDVRVPGNLVDAVVEHPGQRQTTHVVFDPTLVGDAKLDPGTVPRRPEGDAKVVLRRALMETRPGETLAIGFGVPGYLPAVAIEDGLFDSLTFTIEHGVVGGINGYAAGGRTFPVAHNPEAIIDAAAQLRLYAGGGVDCAFLGVGEIDSEGNVNVSRFGDRIPGSGGFIEITQGIRRIVFCTTIGDNGRRKFVDRVQQVTFSGRYARQQGQEILYVTERAVFGLTEHGLTLREIAPGLDVRRDVLDHIGARVHVSADLQPMSSRCFAEAAGMAASPN